ncbi:MAG: type III-A CRISPR-associated RAMP protein Csm5 [Thermodesulforhabdaceae bacterium]
MNVLDVRECYIKILTPLHVGCGEFYEPFSFTVDTSRKEILILDFGPLLRAMDSKLRSDFSNICRKGTIESLLEMYKFLRRLGERKDIINKEGVVSRKIQVSQEFVKHYEEVVEGGKTNRRPDNYNRHIDPRINAQRVITNFAIGRTAFETREKELPIIPGSSIKGAIRTAVLNLWRHNAANKRYSVDQNKDLERDILKGSFHTDPFSLVKVSDFLPVEEPRVKIVYAVNVKKGSGKGGRGPYQILEVVLQGKFKGKITIMEPQNGRDVKQPLGFEDLKGSLREFYKKEFDRELNELKSCGIEVSIPKISGFLIRIGRHSGAECVTIEGFRKIKIMGKSPSYLDHATTLWLASDDRRRPLGARPFGWCELTFGS